MFSVRVSRYVVTHSCLKNEKTFTFPTQIYTRIILPDLPTEILTGDDYPLNLTPRSRRRWLMYIRIFMDVVFLTDEFSECATNNNPSFTRTRTPQ